MIIIIQRRFIRDNMKSLRERSFIQVPVSVPERF